jgi:hypothetical protein
MKVLHFQHMGVGVVLSEALRHMGVDSHVISTAKHPFFKSEVLPRHGYLVHVPFLRSLAKRHDWRGYFDYDVLHSHDGVRMPGFVLAHYRGKLLQHYHDPKTTESIYEPSVPSLVSIPNRVPNGIWVPLPADTALFNPREKPDSIVRVGFCDQHLDPNKSQFIPKKEIMLSAANSRILTNPLTGEIPHDMMPRYYGSIDMWVDRFGLDFYGFAAVEVAAMGIPVIAQIGEEEAKYVPDCPFINTDRKGIPDAIAYLASDEQARKSIGRKCREFILKTHDSMIVARKCLELYDALLGVRQ